MVKDSAKTVLVIAAHPDDEVLGCGATVALLKRRRWRAVLVLMTRGVGGRAETAAAVGAADRQAMDRLAEETRRAARVIGFDRIVPHDFPDNRMDTVARADLAHALSPIIQAERPDLVLTHHPGDYNWDHTLTFEAVMMAARPNPPDFCPPEIRCFEVPSSTERAWQNPAAAFHPNCWVDVAPTIDRKKLALGYYASELRAYPHPRSLEGIEYLARRRGNEIGIEYAEAFHIVRRRED